MKRFITSMMTCAVLVAQAQTKAPKYEVGSYTIDTLNINTEYSDFGASYLGENEVVFASPKAKDKLFGLFTKKWKENKQPYLELYKGQINDKGQIDSVQKFSKQLNSKYHEAQVAFTKDGSTVYFTSNNYLNCKYIKGKKGWNNLQLYRADVDSLGTWSNVSPMPFNNKDYSVGHPALAKNDTELYFVSDMPGGKGATDIYKVTVIGKDRYGKPVNLGDSINTKGKEMFPFVKSDSIIYYSSDSKGDTNGGLDLYASLLREGKVYKTLHLPSPLNSDKDDFALSMKNDQGFISSNRAGGKGDDDIYTFKQLTPIKEIIEKCYQKADITVYDKFSREPLEGIELGLFKNDTLIGDKVGTGKDGKYTFEMLVPNSNYEIRSYSERFRTQNIAFETNDQCDYEVEIPQVKLLDKAIKEVNGKFLIEINPIYFDYNKFNIRKDAAEELEKVISVMTKYKSIIVEGGSHTDSRGNAKYNERLSSKRAKATVDYIRKHGIDNERITSKGYGETQIMNECVDGVKCSDEDHQLNRRTEFVIVKY